MTARAFELLELPVYNSEMVVPHESSNSSVDSGPEDSDGSADYSDVSMEESAPTVVTEFVPKLVLDIGCGSGLSTKVIEEYGHVCIGIDISPSMLLMSKQEVLLGDIGDGIPLRPATFDAVISISAIQWLFHSHRKREDPRKRLTALFNTLNGCMTRGAKAVFQFYPEGEDQLKMMLEIAKRAGFMGGLVVDNPQSSKSKRYYLCLSSGRSFNASISRQFIRNDSHAQPEESVQVQGNNGRSYKARQKNDNAESRRAWVLRKKESLKQKNQETKPNTKYTGRKRRPRF